MIHVKHRLQAARFAIRHRLNLDERGVAAVEFALVFPFMLLLYFGSVEMTQGYTAFRKLTVLARSLADLSAQAASALKDSGGGNDDVTTVFAAASSVFYPFNSAKMAISSIKFQKLASDNQVHGYVDWSIAKSGGTVRACGEVQKLSAAGASPPGVPDALFVDMTSVVIADTSYDFLPLSGTKFMSVDTKGGKVGTGSVVKIPLKQSAYMQPRNQTAVGWSGSSANDCAKPSNFTW